MTLFTFGDTTVILEKVCAYEYLRPRSGPSGADTGQASLRIILDGGADVTVFGQGAVSAFIKAVKALSDAKSS